MEEDLPASHTSLEGSPSWMIRDENYGLRDDDGRKIQDSSELMISSPNQNDKKKSFSYRKCEEDRFLESPGHHVGWMMCGQEDIFFIVFLSISNHNGPQPDG
jgi:hypothetical protein